MPPGGSHDSYAMRAKLVVLQPLKITWCAQPSEELDYIGLLFWNETPDVRKSPSDFLGLSMSQLP